MGQVTRTNFGISLAFSLTNAQVLALVTTPVTILAGISGKAIIPLRFTLALNPRVADYTNIDATAAIALRNGSAAFSSYAAFTVTTLLTGADGARLIQSRTISQTDGFISAIPGAAIVIAASNGALGNFTGGDAGNILRGQLHYTVLPMS